MKIKSLPTNSDGELLKHFTANKKKYTILANEEAFTPIREAWLRKLSTNVFFGIEDDVMYKKLSELQQLIFEQRGVEAITALDAIKVGLFNKNKYKYSKALYLCCLFIVREGEDVTKFDLDYCKEKIDDWNSEGFIASDFFLLAARKLSNLYKMLKEEAQKMPKASLDRLLDNLDVTHSEKIMENLNE